MFGRTNFNTNPDVRRARRIGSAWNRSLARFKGRADGKIQLYGRETDTPQFFEHCQWLRKQQQRAAEIQTHSNRNVAEGIKRCETAREEAIKDLEITDHKIAALMSDSATTHCKLPTSSIRSSITFLILMFFFEFLFSAVSLSTSGLGAMAFEIAIAIIAAAALVWLSEIVGKSLRQLPLSPSAERVDHYRHWIQTILSLLALAAILIGVNFLRSLTNDAAAGDAPANQIVHWALFAVGLGLVIVGIFKSSDHEYSGPLYGLAKLQRRRQKAQRTIARNESTIRRLTEFPNHLHLIAQSSVQKVFAIYSDQYKRSAYKYAREFNRA